MCFAAHTHCPRPFLRSGSAQACRPRFHSTPSTAPAPSAGLLLLLLVSGRPKSRSRRAAGSLAACTCHRRSSRQPPRCRHSSSRRYIQHFTSIRLASSAVVGAMGLLLSLTSCTRLCTRHSSLVVLQASPATKVLAWMDGGGAASGAIGGGDIPPSPQKARSPGAHSPPGPRARASSPPAVASPVPGRPPSDFQSPGGVSPFTEAELHELTGSHSGNRSSNRSGGSNIPTESSHARTIASLVQLGPEDRCYRFPQVVLRARRAGCARPAVGPHPAGSGAVPPPQTPKQHASLSVLHELAH